MESEGEAWNVFLNKLNWYTHARAHAHIAKYWGRNLQMNLQCNDDVWASNEHLLFFGFILIIFFMLFSTWMIEAPLSKGETLMAYSNNTNVYDVKNHQNASLCLCFLGQALGGGGLVVYANPSIDNTVEIIIIIFTHLPNCKLRQDLLLFVFFQFLVPNLFSTHNIKGAIIKLWWLLPESL